MLESNNKLFMIILPIGVIPSTIAFSILESGLLLVTIVFSFIFGSIALYWILDRKYCLFNAGHDFQVKSNQDFHKRTFIVYCVKCGIEKMEYVPN